MERSKELILIYGCPGSGKSTFARSLAERWDRPVLLVSGDEVEGLVGEYGSEAVATQFMKVRQGRLKGTTTLGTVLFGNMDVKNVGKDFDPQVWQESRRLIRETIAVIMSISETVIIQDDMLLRSMRKSFRNYCADNSVTYLEILMKTSLEDCIKFNSIRGLTVPQEVLTDKFQKLEAGGGFQLELNQRNSQSILKLIKKSLIVPDKPVQAIKVEYQNDLEQTDIAIRKIISQIISSDLKIFELFGKKMSKKEVGQIISKFKKQYNMKNGSFNFQIQLRQYLQYLNHD